MLSDRQFFPHVMTKGELNFMRDAFVLALAMRPDELSAEEKERVAAGVFRFYSRGLSDLHKLAELALLSASSRIFRQPSAPRDRERTGRQDQFAAGPM